MRLIRSSLLSSVAEPLNLEYRSNMMLGSLEAGLAFSNASLGAVHAMAHSIGGLLDLPHGQCNAMLFDHVVDFNYPGAEQRYKEVAINLGLDVQGLSTREVRKKIVEEIRRFRDAAGIRTTLGECGVHRTEVHELATNTLDDPCLVTNPRQPGQRDLEVIYEESL